MDLSKILNSLYRYLWLLVLTAIVASLTTFLVINNEPVSYRATTQLLVGPSLDSPSPDLNALRIGGQLIYTYAELAATRSFLEAVNNKLDQKIDLELLNDAISTRQNTETRVLTISVFHPDPKQAVAIANAAAQTFVEMSPSKDNSTTLLRTQMGNQTQQLEDIVAKSEVSIQQLEAELVELKKTRVQGPEETGANLERQRLIINQLADERTRSSDALRTLASIYQILMDTNTNQVAIIEPATTVVPVERNILLRVATSAISGLVLALVIMLAAEYFDDRIRFPGDLTRTAKVPMLSIINKHKRLDGSGSKKLVTFTEPTSHAANSYREVVAKILFSIGESVPYSFLLSGVGTESGDDTAVVAGNLAVALAQAGKRVVLVDAQIHNPVLTKMFRAENKDGLTEHLVSGSVKPPLISVEDIPGIRFLPAGLSVDKGTGGMLDSAKIARLIAEVQKDADLVLVAGSPISWFAESLTLASQLNATILVARYGEAHSKTVNKVVENLRAMDIQIAGVIFDYNPSPFVGRAAPKIGSSVVTPVASQANVSEQTSKS
jgi:polysaccharide biosynthesis transport protein